MKELHSGTTIAAINCGAAGVVIGSESRATIGDAMGNRRILKDTFKKLFVVDNHAIFAFAGQVGVGLRVKQNLHYTLGAWRDMHRGLSAKGKIRTLSSILSQITGGASIVAILALWDAQHVRIEFGEFAPRGGRLCMVMSDGAYVELESASIGSGGPSIEMEVLRYCDEIPITNRDPLEAARLLYDLLYRVSKVDPGSGGEPLIRLVDANGIKKIAIVRHHEIKGG